MDLRAVLRAALIAPAVALISGGAVAQWAPEFTYIEACRIDPTSAVIRLVYQGSDCETTAEPATVRPSGSNAGVSIPSALSGGTCIAQMVPNYVLKVIAIDAAVTTLDVTVLFPAGQVQGQQTVALQPAGPACEPPQR
jgi:hypothetical protein